ncbi:MAG TPA: DUF6057 family protein [Phycisphaerae bacterium]|jgi:hypothetical protein|nr:DUF6057 family protein [Phycisphaerae bacterium]HOL25449.1 DUF6057 family protein [Phycisphaerae bacterium]HPP19874.1 DUF6057 family protein [Phycisphaerae bacterium]HXK85003.1 DUF6057 family protein [Phycisphaerae bacterium]
MSAASNATGGGSLRRLIRQAVVLGLLYLHVFWVVDPRLLLHSQSPAFFAGWTEFTESLGAWPGGLIEYAAAGLAQTFAFPWLGAAVLTVGIGLAWVLTERLLAAAGASRFMRDWAFVPLACLLVLLNRYTLSLGAILSLVVALLPALMYARLPFRQSARVLTAVGMCIVVYVLAGPVSILLACLCGMMEILSAFPKPDTSRIDWPESPPLSETGPATAPTWPPPGVISPAWSIAAGMSILLLGAAIPYLAGTHVYRIGVHDTWTRQTALEHDRPPLIASIALYASLPLGLILASGLPAGLIHRMKARLFPNAGRRRSDRPSIARKKSPHGSAQPRGSKETSPTPAPAFLARFRAFLASALPLLAGAAVVWITVEPDRAAVLRLDYHVRNRQWDAALAAAEPLRWSRAMLDPDVEQRLATLGFASRFPAEAQTPAPLLPSLNVAIHNVNFALAQQGRLLDCMFEYPQRMGASVVRLLPDDEGAYVAHSYNFDILLELGHVNEAERVVCESFANVGPRPWLLKRLTRVNVLKGRPQAAHVCLNRLARVPGWRAWAETIRAELNKDPALSGRPDLQRIRSRMYRQDHVGHLEGMHPDEQMLRYLLVANPHNRLAFDYLTAHYLLTLRDDKVAENMRYLADFGYTHVPRHAEESILLLAKLTRQMPDLRGFTIRPETIRRFEAFTRDLDLLGDPGGRDNLRIRDALMARYGDTYWFYALFGHTFFGRNAPPPPADQGRDQ